MGKKEYCFNCNEETEYNIKTEKIDTEVGEVKFSYDALVAFCSKCGGEISIPEVNDLNIIRAYQKHKELLDKS